MRKLLLTLFLLVPSVAHALPISQCVIGSLGGGGGLSVMNCTLTLAPGNTVFVIYNYLDVVPTSLTNNRGIVLTQAVNDTGGSQGAYTFYASTGAVNASTTFTLNFSSPCHFCVLFAGTYAGQYQLDSTAHAHCGYGSPACMSGGGFALPVSSGALTTHKSSELLIANLNCDTCGGFVTTSGFLGVDAGGGSGRWDEKTSGAPASYAATYTENIYDAWVITLAAFCLDGCPGFKRKSQVY